MIEVKKTVQNTWRTLANVWEAFIDPPKRLKTLLPWLLKFLDSINDGRPIVDLCAGIGVEVNALAENGFNIIPNEIDNNLRKIGIDRIQKSSSFAIKNTEKWRSDRWEQIDGCDWNYSFCF